MVAEYYDNSGYVFLFDVRIIICIAGGKYWELPVMESVPDTRPPKSHLVADATG